MMTDQKDIQMKKKLQEEKQTPQSPEALHGQESSETRVEISNKSSFTTWFTPVQRRMISTGVTVFFTGLVVAFTAFLLWVFCRALSSVSIVVLPFLVAIILTALCKPYFTWIRNHVYHRNSALSLLVFYSSILLPLGFILHFFGSMLVAQLIALIDYLPELIQKTYNGVVEYVPSIQAFIDKYSLTEKFPILNNPDAVFAEMIQKLPLRSIGGTAWGIGVGAVKSIFSFISWMIVPVYMAYFLLMPKLDKKTIEKFLPLPKQKAQVVAELASDFLDLLVRYFRVQANVAFILGVLFALSFWAIGLPYGLLIGFVLGLLNLIPYLGNVIGLMIALPVAFFGDEGSLWRAGLVILIFCIIQIVDGYWITPKKQGKEMKMSDVAIIFSMLFWGVVFQGILGVLLAIPLSAFVVVLWKKFHEFHWEE